MMRSYSKQLLATQWLLCICTLFFVTQCSYTKGITPEISEERQSTPLSTRAAYPTPTPTASITPMVMQKQSNLPPPLPSGSSISTGQASQNGLNLSVFATIPPDDYLVYIFQKEIHILSLDGSVDRVIGKEEDISFIRYGKIAVFSKACNCTIIYEFVNGELKEYGHISAPDNPGCRRAIALNLKWYGEICQDSSQLLIKDVKQEWSKVIEERTAGTDEAFYFPGFDWSANSDWMAYFRVGISAPPPGESDFALINVSCQDQDNNCSMHKFGPYKIQNQTFDGQGASAWSYDSKSFAFASSTTSPIYVFNIDSKAFTTLNFDKKYYIKQLIWLPDGKTLTFSQDFRIYTASINGGKPVMVIDKAVDPENELSLLGWISTVPKP